MSFLIMQIDVLMKIYKTNEVCELLGICRSTLSKIKEDIGYVFLNGRIKFLEEDIKEYLLKKRIKKQND